MKTSLTVTETARNFSDIINRVTYKGERFILLKGKRAVAEISPIKSGRPLSELPGILAKLPPLSAKEAESFAKDLEQLHQDSRGTEGVKDPWES